MAQVELKIGIKIEYDTFGSPDDPALLLVMGYGAQLVNWRPTLLATWPMTAWACSRLWALNAPT